MTNLGLLLMTIILLAIKVPTQSSHLPFRTNYQSKLLDSNLREELINIRAGKFIHLSFVDRIVSQLQAKLTGQNATLILVNRLMWYYTGVLRNPSSGRIISGIQGIEYIQRLPRQYNNDSYVDSYMTSKLFTYVKPENNSDVLNTFRLNPVAPKRKLKPSKIYHELIQYEYPIIRKENRFFQHIESSLIQMKNSVILSSKPLLNNVQQLLNNHTTILSSFRSIYSIPKSSSTTVTTSIESIKKTKTKIKTKITKESSIISNHPSHIHIQFPSSREIYSTQLIIRPIGSTTTATTTTTRSSSSSSSSTTTTTDSFSGKNGLNSRSSSTKQDQQSEENNGISKRLNGRSSGRKGIEVINYIRGYKKKSMMNKWISFASPQKDRSGRSQEYYTLTPSKYSYVPIDIYDNYVQNPIIRLIDRIIPFRNIRLLFQLPGRPDYIMKYQRIGESPPWYSVGHLCTTELIGRRYSALIDIPAPAQTLFRTLHPEFIQTISRYQYTPESFTHLTDEYLNYRPWYRKLGNILHKK